MQESHEIDWTATEFALAGVLLVALGALYEIAKPSITKENYRVVAAGALVALVVTVWAHGAVNVF